MIKISDLFDVKYWVNLELNSLELDNKWINFVSRTSKNNWVSAIVKNIYWLKTQKAWTISVATSWTVLETFLQPKEYYSWRDLYFLTPKIELTEREKIFYCMVIKSNKYRYSYWRQANTTLKDLLIPSKDEIPNWVYTSIIPNYSDIKENLNKNKLSLDNKKFQYFEIQELFDLEKWKWPLVSEIEEVENWTNFVTASEKNNWVSYKIDYEPTHKWNTISIASNWSVWEAFYQEQPFCATWDLNILIPKFDLNKYIATFIISIIRKEKYRFSYGRKWWLEKMKTSKIKLPIDEYWNPDFKFMEDYIKSLNYSKYL